MQSTNSLKDFRIKYNSLSGLSKGRSEEEFLVSENVLKLELKTCQESLLKEKQKVKELTEEKSIYISQIKQLENHAKLLTDMVADKDSLISRLWNDIISIKKSKNVNEIEILAKVENENEISTEGLIGDLPNSVGKSMISSLAPNFMKKRQEEINETKKLRNELADSQMNYRILHERMKELSEIYSKLEIEAQELRESLKFQKENSVQLTKQILKINGEKEAGIVKACLENDELSKKLEISEIEKRKVVSQLKSELERLREDLVNESMVNKSIKQEIHLYKEENEELKAEIREFAKILKNKEAENRELALNLHESQIKAIKASGLQNELCRDIKDYGLAKCCCRVLSAPDSQALSENIRILLKSRKLKIRALKKTIENLTTELSKQPKEPEIFFSNYTTNTFLNETSQKLSENFTNPGPVYYNVEKLKIELEKQKNAKRKARAEKEQVKEDLAHAILEISEVNSELLQFKLKADDQDFLAFLVVEAKLAEDLLLNKV